MVEVEVPKLLLPELSINPSGWGPSLECPKLQNGMPFASFNKNDRLGMVADWTGDTYSDKRMLNKYQVHYGSHNQYSGGYGDDDEAFQLVDQTKNQRTGGHQRGRVRMNQRNMRNRNQNNRQNPNQNMQVLRRNVRNPRGNNRFGNQRGRGRYDPRNQAKKRDASVNIRPEWKIIEEMDFPRLGKLSLPGITEGKDIYTCGSLEFYDKTYDRVNVKSEKLLQRINRIHHKVTTTDDPIIRKLSKTDGNVYATDAIIAALMCATRSGTSWDVVVQRVGNKLFFDKRDDSEFDLLTVNETAAEPPFNEDSTSINNPRNLALEATYINHNFSQQVLKQTDKEAEKYSFKNPNPFVSEEDESEVVSVAYRYRKFDLGDGVELVVRCEHDAVTIGSNGEPQFMNIKALNEWDSRVAGAIDWRQKLDLQRGAVLANELKNNSCKLARWTVQALLAGSDHIKFGYVSRIHFRDSAKHAILGTQQFKPREFADQTNLNLDNAWGVLRCIIDTCLKLDQGKYLILKDPNKPTLLIYDIPNDTFETDDEDDGEEDDIEEENEDGDEASEEKK